MSAIVWVGVGCGLVGIMLIGLVAWLVYYCRGEQRKLDRMRSNMVSGPRGGSAAQPGALAPVTTTDSKESPTTGHATSIAPAKGSPRSGVIVTIGSSKILKGSGVSGSSARSGGFPASKPKRLSEIRRAETTISTVTAGGSNTFQCGTTKASMVTSGMAKPPSFRSAGSSKQHLSLKMPSSSSLNRAGTGGVVTGHSKFSSAHDFGDSAVGTATQFGSFGSLRSKPTPKGAPTPNNMEELLALDV